jgi:hypothetical protein
MVKDLLDPAEFRDSGKLSDFIFEAYSKFIQIYCEPEENHSAIDELPSEAEPSNSNTN